MKKLLALALVLSMVFFAGCGNGGTDDDNSGSDAAKKQTLVVGATPTPHGEMLAAVKDKLAEEGIDLQITEFTEYPIQNTALESGEIDANFFQHQPYLDTYNKEKGTDLISAGSVHFEPLGVYPGKTAKLEDIADGAQIAVPNDVSNEARALQLLESLGLIKVNPDAGLEATPIDIIENPHNIKFVEMEAAAVTRAIADVDFAVVNGNFALDAGIIDTVITTEDPQSEAAKQYANIVAVKSENLEDPRIKALVAALTGEDMRTFIEEKYGIVVVPVF